MMKSIVSSASLALVIACSGVAAAQTAGGSSCPPGSWFCANAPQQQTAPAGEPLQPLPPPDEPAPPPARPPSSAPPPPVVVYEPPPRTAAFRAEVPPPYDYEPPPRRMSLGREWGLNLHLEGAMIGRGSGGDAGMGGAGGGLRLKPTRYFGIEGDLDFVGGNDYQGDHRSETALSFNGLLFLNPRSHAQIYLLAGFGWSWAHASCDPNAMSCSQALDAHYTYFGAQAGVGLEFRLSHALALNADLRGFIRGRTDHLAETQPEFTDAAGRTTNTSGGALLTGGMTIYF